MTRFLPFMLLLASANLQVHGQTVTPPAALSEAMPSEPTQPGGVAAELSPDAERRRIQGERDRVEGRFATDQAACYLKFAVNDCSAAARVVRREALADLRRQEVSLNAAEAKRRGAEQLSRIEEKSSPQTEFDAANRRATALLAQQARLADADEKAAARSAAGLTTDARVGEDKDRADRLAKAQAERTANAAAAKLAQKKYDDRQKEAQTRAEQRRKRQAGEAKPTAKPLEAPAVQSP